MIALALGILTGIFFGEMVSFLKVIGDAYVRLLQMTVLPYIFVSLVSGLGRLTYRQAGQIAMKAGTVLLILWAIGFATMLLGTLAYPDWKAASFFSTALVESGKSIDFLQLYIPANLFYSLTNTIVPAIVVFSLALGGSLIAVDNKEPLLELLHTLGEALMRITRMVVWVAPLGIFAITASAAGTMRAEEFDRLQVFIWIYAVIWLVLLFWALPLLVAAFTPARYRDLLLHARAALVTAFATGSLLIVIPMMADAIKKMVAEHMEDSEEAEAMVDVLVPTAYNFPTLGMITMLGFIPFAAWFHGAPFSVLEYSRFAGIGLFSAFGGSNIALPYLLDAFALPSDLFQLFLVSNVLVGRMAMSVGAMHIIVLCLVSLSLMYGGFRFSPKRIAGYVVLVATVTVAFVLSTGFVIDRAIPHEYTLDQSLVGMHMLDRPVASTVHEDLPTALSTADRQQPRFDVIRARGTIRVGYLPDQLPFAFRNSSGEVVGLDIAMAHELARDLDVTLEIVRLPEESMLAKALELGQLDIVMSGHVLTPVLSAQFALTPPHLEQTFAFVVDDHRRAEFSSIRSVQAMTSLRLAVPEEDYYLRRIRNALPDAEIVPVKTPRSYFRGQLEVDALAFTAEAGSAWSLIYPDYTIAIPKPLIIKIPMTYVFHKSDVEFRRVVGDWLELKRRDGTIDDLFDYWILGRTQTVREPRWSVIREVLHWVE